MMTAETTKMSPSPVDAGGKFEQFTNDVYGWAYRLLGRHHDALDVVQDVFLKWTSQCSTDAPQQPRGWLRRVTLNRAIDLIRERRTGDASEAALLGTATATPRLVGIEQDELRADVSTALAALTDLQRGVLVAKVYDGLTFAQIAEELNLALSTAKTHYVRAIKHVGNKLQTRWDREDLS